MMPAPFPASQLHTNTDIRNVMRALLATHESTRRFQPDTPELNAYTAGFEAALRLLAEALNVNLGANARHYVDR